MRLADSLFPASRLECQLELLAPTQMELEATATIPCLWQGIEHYGDFLENVQFCLR